MLERYLHLIADGADDLSYTYKVCIPLLSSLCILDAQKTVRHWQVTYKLADYFPPKKSECEISNNNLK